MPVVHVAAEIKPRSQQYPPQLRALSFVRETRENDRSDRIQGFAIIASFVARAATDKGNAEEISLRAERTATGIMMLAFNDWRINSNDGRTGRGKTSSTGVISSPKKKKKKKQKSEWLRVFIEPSARKFREDRLSILLNDRKKDTRPFNVDYVYLGKIGISSTTQAVIFSLCYLANAINNIIWNAYVFLTDSPSREFITLVLFPFALRNETESDFISKSYVRRDLFIIIYLIMCPCTKSSGQQRTATPTRSLNFLCFHL